MPVLPQIRAPANLSVQQRPAVQPRMQEIGRMLGEYADQEERQQLQDFDINAQTAIRGELMGLRERLAGVADPDEYRNTYEQGVDEIRQRLSPQAGEYGERQFAFRLNQALNSEADNIAAGVIERRRGAALANAQTSYDLAVKQSAEMLDPLKRHERMTEYGLEVEQMPFLSTLERAKLKDKFAHDVDRERGYLLLESNPQQLLDSLKDKDNYPELQGSERETLREHAQDALARMRRDRNELQREALDEKNRLFLQANVDGTLTQRTVLSSDLPFEAQRFWIDRLNAQDKAAAKLPANQNPFEHSDPEIRGKILTEMMLHPEQWTEQRILGFMGRGLSTNHTLQAVNILKAKNKKTGDLPPQYDPLRRAMNQLDNLRNHFAFLPKGTPEPKPGEVTREARFENGKNYNKVVDKVLARVEAGQDPMEAVEEEMKPYFEDKARGWFDWLWTPRTPQANERVPGLERQLEATVGAVQQQSEALRKLKEAKTGTAITDDEVKAELTRRRKAITPENIRAGREIMMQQRRTTPAPAPQTYGPEGY